MTFFDFRGAAP